jgi:DNA-binding NarL/FixJ family response regulator
MNNAPIRIIMVDDHELVRNAWIKVLENNPEFKVVADCDNGQTAIELARDLVPDIMFVDINMAPVNGFIVTEKISEETPSIKIIGLSVNNQLTYATKMIDLGAKGYLTKTSTLEEVYRCIMEVQKGNLYICEEVMKSILPSDQKNR